MMADRGMTFLLKFGDGAPEPTYSTVAGLRPTAMSINGDEVEAAPRDGWRTLVEGAGTRSLSINATGIFLGGEAEAQTRTYALTGALPECELSFEDGTRLRGRFLIQRLDYAGDYNGERNYTIQLESAGKVTATASAALAKAGAA